MIVVPLSPRNAAHPCPRSAMTARPPRARIASLENGIAYWRTAGVAGNDALEAGWRTHTLREEQTGGARERARAVDDLVDLEEAAFRGVEDALVMNREGTIRRGDDQIPLILEQVVRITGLEVQQSESRGPPASTAQKTARFARGSGIARCSARPSGVARSPSGRPRRYCRSLGAKQKRSGWRERGKGRPFVGSKLQ